MRFAVFGLTIRSSWGNAHAAHWRGLLRALARRGHRIVFFERDLPVYAAHRDPARREGIDLVLYDDWPATRSRAARAVAESDVAIVASSCPDALDATDLVLDERGSRLRVFYDLDALVTLRRLREGLPVDCVGPRGLSEFDLILSSAGGAALAMLEQRLHARRVAPLYESVDPLARQPLSPAEEYRSDLSYLGAHAEDRPDALERLLLVPARRRPGCRFVVGGSGCTPSIRWPSNVSFARHVPPPERSRFYSSSRLTLSLTQRPTLELGHGPSGHLFEAAACETTILTDDWEGLDRFFEPGREVLVVRSPEDVTQALAMPPEDALAIGRAARERALAEHTVERRAVELEEILAGIGARAGASARGAAEAVRFGEIGASA